MLDKLNFHIVKALSENARLTYAQIAKLVHLSPPAVAERIKKLEESDVITGYKPTFNLEKLGVPVEALVECSVHQAMEKKVKELLLSLDEVIKVYTVTGNSEYVVHVGVSNMSHLQRVIERMNQYSDTTTKMVLSTPHNDVLPQRMEKLAS